MNLIRKSPFSIWHGQAKKRELYFMRLYLLLFTGRFGLDGIDAGDRFGRERFGGLRKFNIIFHLQVHYIQHFLNMNNSRI